MEVKEVKNVATRAGRWLVRVCQRSCFLPAYHCVYFIFVHSALKMLTYFICNNRCFEDGSHTLMINIFLRIFLGLKKKDLFASVMQLLGRATLAVIRAYTCGKSMFERHE